MPGTNEAFSRVKIDAQLKDQGWDVLDINAVCFEYVLPDKTKADYVLCDRNGRALAVIEAKKAATARRRADAAGVPRQPRRRGFHGLRTCEPMARSLR
jgi:type I restriction enzyme, R subunit